MRRLFLVRPKLIASALFAAVLGFAALPAMAQTPSKAQQSAIRSACPGDYRTYCASVPPGGKPALACLQQNAAKLSDACRTAVQAVGGSAATPATPTPPVGGAAKSGAAQQGAATPGTAKTTGAAPKGKAPAAADLAPHEAALVRQACRRDFRTHCRGVPIGGGNVIACLKANAASLSPRCQSALAPFAR
ncbi:MAG: cysteine rich repeat-containing protein [Candidatus Kaistia colombiensis]|nr:MAG: cysteine rich repeat-containing protein [Kaistia sp.]